LEQDSKEIDTPEELSDVCREISGYTIMTSETSTYDNIAVWYGCMFA